MKKKKKQHDEHMGEDWLLPYADMLTLLLALFIVLFAASEVDSQKYEQLSQVFESEFAGGDGILEHNDSPKEPFAPPKDESVEEHPDEEQEQAEHKKDIKRLEQLQSSINQYIKENELAKSLETYLTDEGLMVSILNDVNFEPGSAEIKGRGLKVADDISKFLVTDPPREIVVSGHTDNIPISNKQFSSNWELSVERAVNFMSLLLKNEQLEPHRFSAKGYGEHKPVVPNDSIKNRAQNRRVEVLILPYY